VRSLRPERVDDDVDGDDLAAPHGEEREKRALLRRSEVDLLPAAFRIQRAEDRHGHGLVDRRAVGVRRCVPFGARRSAIRSQAGGVDVEEVLGRVEVLEAVLAEVAKGDFGRKLLFDEPARHARKNDLPAVCNRADPRRSMHPEPDVALAAAPGLARVKPHSFPASIARHRSPRAVPSWESRSSGSEQTCR
jgi:hypothetical protein